MATVSIPAELKYEAKYEHWESTRHLAWLGEEVGINILADEAGPNAHQLKLYGKIVARRRSMRKRIETVFFEHYQKEVYDFGFTVMTRDGENVPTPRLSNSAEIWDLLTVTWLTIHETDEDTESTRFTLSFSCDWDDEHSTTILIENWEIKDLGDSGAFF